MDVEQEIINRIQAAHPNAQIDLTDQTGGGDHWEAVVICEEFEGWNRLKRQRAIYKALGDLMRGPVHALGLQTLTPSEAKAQ